MRVGVDIGGTFTDFCLSQDGRLRIHKVLSTPDDPAAAMLAGLTSLSDSGLAAISRVSHGSTVATNAVLERKGAPTALIVTQGFRDILEIGRQNRPHLYALQPSSPPPLIPREWCYEVPERLDHTGAVLTPLDLSALDRVLDDVTQRDIVSVAVCFLYSHVNPSHERAVESRILQRGLLQENQVVLSSKVLPQFREYERASTVALEAYVRPVVSGYLRRLEQGLPETCSLQIMKSDGGVVSAQRARQLAVQTVLSGPAAGVIGGFALALHAGYDQAITLDMGGTSTDVAVCPGHLVRRTTSEIDGLPLRTRMLDIETIGAGGGSIARLDPGGVLRVGPESAGARPGPIVYGRGGSQMTVTDANAILGRMDKEHFLGGAMRLYPDKAQAALASLAQQMRLDPEAAALGIVQVANASIDRALRRVSVARGHDPRDFALVAFGGAGPLHACEVAAALEIPRVLVPRHPGVLCALGLLMADVVLERSRSVLGLLTPERESDLRGQLNEMIAQAEHDLAEEGFASRAMIFRGSVDARYQGQSHELTVDLVPGDTENAGPTCALQQLFHDAHSKAYGHAMPGNEVEAVHLRLQAIGLVDKPAVERETCVESDGNNASLGPIRVLCPDGPRQFERYHRELLRPGAAFAGPALVLQMDSTVLITPGWSARVDGYRNLILERAT